MQGREGIIGHPRSRCRDSPEQGRFAGIRLAEQTHISQQGQLQAQAATLTGGPRTRLARCPVDAALEVLIAATALAAGRNHEFLAFLGQVPQQLAGIRFDDAGTRRYRNTQGGSATPGALAAGTRLTMFSSKSAG